MLSPSDRRNGITYIHNSYLCLKYKSIERKVSISYTTRYECRSTNDLQHSESKFGPTISDSVVLPQNSEYEIVGQKYNRQGVGGVSIAVKNILVASPVTDVDTDCYVTCCRIEIANSKPLFIRSFCRSPSSDDPDVINKVHESVSKLTCKDTAFQTLSSSGTSTGQTSFGKIPPSVWIILC